MGEPYQMSVVGHPPMLAIGMVHDSRRPADAPNAVHWRGPPNHPWPMFHPASLPLPPWHAPPEEYVQKSELEMLVEDLVAIRVQQEHQNLDQFQKQRLARLEAQGVRPA